MKSTFKPMNKQKQPVTRQNTAVTSADRNTPCPQGIRVDGNSGTTTHYLR